MKLKVGIVGNGNVGSAIERGLARAGYEARAVGSEPAEVAELGRWGELIVLAVPFAARFDALRELGDAIGGKILIDVTNAIAPDMRFALGPDQSGAEQLQARAPAAKVVKAFNTIFAKYMDQGELDGVPLTFLAAGDDADAKRTVLELGRALGFDAIDAGPLLNSRWLEAMGFLNVQLAYAQKMGPSFGIKLVHAGAAKGQVVPEKATAPERTGATH